ncbi:TPA: hypothetical protein ACH3X1_008516 [Trebouxia sp. C0004]
MREREKEVREGGQEGDEAEDHTENEDAPGERPAGGEASLISYNLSSRSLQTPAGQYRSKRRV